MQNLSLLIQGCVLNPAKWPRGPDTNTDMLSSFFNAFILCKAHFLLLFWLEPGWATETSGKTGSGPGQEVIWMASGDWGGAAVMITQCGAGEEPLPVSGPWFTHLYFVRGLD